MDCASDCEVHSVQESACDEDVLTPQMSNRGVRTVYLITYSQAGCTRFPTREEFANIVLRAFCETKKGQSDVVQWVCSREEYSAGDTHYHNYGRKAFGTIWMITTGFKSIFQPTIPITTVRGNTRQKRILNILSRQVIRTLQIHAHHKPLKQVKLKLTKMVV